MRKELEKEIKNWMTNLDEPGIHFPIDELREGIRLILKILIAEKENSLKCSKSKQELDSCHSSSPCPYCGHLGGPL